MNSYIFLFLEQSTQSLLSNSICLIGKAVSLRRLMRYLSADSQQTFSSASNFHEFGSFVKFVTFQLLHPHLILSCT